MRKWTLLFLTCIGAGSALYLGAMHRLTDGFSISKIKSDLPYAEKSQIPQEISNILAQPFYYLGKGSQMYVFASEDGEFVLKFFRNSRYQMRTLPGLPSFLDEIQTARLQEKHQKRDHLFTSCQIAFTQLRKESGLVYLHLKKSQTPSSYLLLHDKLKRPFQLEIGKVEFIIQKRGEQIYPYLARLIKEGRREEARAALFDLTRLLNVRFGKGIADGDAVIHKNSGFREGRAMYLDVGQFSLNLQLRDPMLSHVECVKVTRRLREWLEKRDPKLAQYFEALL